MPPSRAPLLSSLRSRWSNQSETGRAARNVLWLFVGRGVLLVATVTVGAWVARFLGPSRFGLMNYCIAVVAMPSTLSTAGINAIVVRDLVSKVHEPGETMASGAVLRLVGAALHIVTAVALAMLLRPGDVTILWFVVLIASGHLLRVSDVLDFWFQARVESKYSVWANTVATLIISAMRVVLVSVQAPLILFVATFPLTMLVVAVALLAFYRRHAAERLTRWKLSGTVVRKMLRDSWALFLAGAAVVIYMKVDQVMIGQMLGDRELGQYSVAVRISEAWYFVPTAIGTSFLPGLIRARQVSREDYLERVQRLMDGCFWLSASIALGVSLFAGPIIQVLYGAAYAAAAPVLVVHVWSAIFVFWGVATSQYLVAENLTRISLFRTTLGVVVNVVLNVLWIPRMGIMGAAWATLIAYMVSGWLAHALVADVRILFVMGLKSLHPRRALGALKSLALED